MDATGLRVGATCVVAAVFAGAFAFVTAHPKNPDAPLQPPAANAVAPASPAPSVPALGLAPRGRPGRATPAPRITLAPGVQATALPGLTFTHVS